MYTPFSRTLRALRADRSRRLTLGVGAGLLGAWVLWFFLSEVTLYAVSSSARLEVDAAARALEAEVSGRISAMHAALDAQVEAGEVLLELEAGDLIVSQQLALAELDFLFVRQETITASLAVMEEALSMVQGAADASQIEAQARYEAAWSAASLASQEASRVTDLQAGGTVAEGAAARATAEARQRRATARAARQARERISQEGLLQLQDRQLELAALRQDVARIESEIAATDASLVRIQRELERRLIRAPVAGRIAELASVRVGDLVEAGADLGAVLPDGELVVVAWYSPAEALGRIATGQAARLRLAGFPWTQYGDLQATVAAVAAAPRDGRIRVDLTVDADSAARSSIPLQHGLEGTVEVVIERLSPAELTLRAAGDIVRSSAP